MLCIYIRAGKHYEMYENWNYLSCITEKLGFVNVDISFTKNNNTHDRRNIYINYTELKIHIKIYTRCFHAIFIRIVGWIKHKKVMK